ncbi:MAG: hypothetical protein ACRDL1_12515 [Solirubrobacterales bacterium]
MSTGVSSAFREITAEREGEYVAKGHNRRHFFPHRIYHLPKCGPDGFKLAERMCGRDNPAMMWELVLYADPAMLAEFPADLFFDDELIWHQQQFGRPGQVASASIVLDGSTVYSITHVSDLVQRISRRREHKTRIEKRFEGWCHMLLNAVLAFAEEHRARRVCTPTAALARRHTDPSRAVGIGLLDRIYDRTVNALPPARRDGEWWVIKAADVGDRVVTPERGTETHPKPRTICICHDVERGMGHADVDPAFARRAERTSPRDLSAMRQVEADLGVRATYFVVGSLLSELRDGLEAEGHALGFHSFDHRLERGQLRRCREVDYRIKGYRPPSSRITPELSDRSLLFHNFEWLASSPRSLGVTSPEMRAGLVRLPIAFDDFPLHEGRLPYEEWERTALRVVSRSDFAAISLHDCYAPRWLSDYRGFLEQVQEMGELRTLDEMAADVTLSCAA